MKFGRIIHFDERSRNYPIRALIPHTTPRSYTWSCPIVLDQGDVGACTGFSVSHEAAARPVKVKGITNQTGLEVYYRARQLDEFPGEDYEGSSVLGAMKAGKERGWYEQYRWAFGEQDLRLAVSWYGPAVLGVNWYSEMMEPDGNGVIHVTGSVEGGHAILCNGFNVRTGLYRLHNSWGPAWGKNGECFIPKEELAELLLDQGEACIPVVRTQPK